MNYQAPPKNSHAPGGAPGLVEQESRSHVAGAQGAKQSRMVGRTKSVDLSRILFSAKIDFVTIETPCRLPLPELQGRAIWPSTHRGERLTVQDLTRRDVSALHPIFGILPIIELEVAVDVRPRPAVHGKARVRMLEQIMIDLFASELDPSGKGMLKQFRAAYRRLENGYDKVMPFNLKLPHHHDQQLHGGRKDDCQVKCYLKRTDQKKPLTEDNWVARVEVRLCDDGLRSRGLDTIADMAGFKFRKQLMPFFTHVNGSRRLRHRTKLPAQYQDPIYGRRDTEDRLNFERHGVGCLKDGHKVRSGDVRLTRDIQVNHRIGQALMRLEKQFRTQEVRAFEIDGADA